MKRLEKRKRKNKPFNRKKPLAEPDSGRAVCLNQLGVERTGKKGQQAP